MRSSHLLRGTLLAAALLSTASRAAGPAAAADDSTHSPIRHVIVIIGENRSFDHVFATYAPLKGETVWNLLSQGIVRADGKPGPNFARAQQQAASDPAADAFLLSPSKSPFAGNVMPAPLVGGPASSPIPNDSLTLASELENGLPPEYYRSLVMGGAGLPAKTPDTRITDVNALPAGPFQLTNGKTFLYTSYAASPVHRFYQMWQQLDCSAARTTAANPAGCDAQLFSWVEVTVGHGSNGMPQPPNFSTTYGEGLKVTGEGSTALGFYNMQQGDVPYFKSLADQYAMNDNYHQPVQGGTGANHVMLGHGDLIWFSDGAGHPAVPPHGVPVAHGSANHGVVDEIENPNPAPGTNNWYLQDGYGGGSSGSASFGGGSYSNCADSSGPGVAPIVNYLKALRIDPHCEAGHYYLLNNYNPGYFGDGSNAFTDNSPRNTVFTVPPSSLRSIGDELIERGISWKYYGAQWNNYLKDPYQGKAGANGAATNQYCNICNPFQYDTSIMSNAAARSTHLKDTIDLYTDIAAGTLPAIAFVKPSSLVDGHPASSKLDLFEGFTRKIVDAVRANPRLWKDTAIFITFDEGGGYYDSGYVQPLDFFGDGTRIPFIVVSRFNRAGHISHQYTDHVSILKFIERNWGLAPVTDRSRDNLPNPVSRDADPYVPANSPAIGDLWDLFDFGGV